MREALAAKPLERLRRVVAELHERRVPILIESNGLQPEARQVLDGMAAPDLQVVHHEGFSKLKLYREGFRRMAKWGVRGVLVIDASGPFSFGAAQHFLKLARKFPAQLLCGYAVKIETPMRRQRVTGQHLIDFSTGFCGLTLSHEDALCPMRLYPLDATLSVLTNAELVANDGFETEFLVRLLWAGLRVRNLPVPASTDELMRRPSWWTMAPLFTKLFLVMLTRLPILVCSRVVGWAPEDASPYKTRPERKLEKPEQLEALARMEKARAEKPADETAVYPASALRNPKPAVDPAAKAKAEALVEEVRQRAEAARDELTKEAKAERAAVRAAERAQRAEQAERTNG